MKRRALTDAERTELRLALEPVLRDLRVSGAIVPRVRKEAWDNDPESVQAWIELSGPTGCGIYMLLRHSAAERVANLADQIQEWEVEELCAAGRPATWPQCPIHPDSHPLSPAVHDGSAVWRCPRSGDVICPIGTL
jgi:hypothetical protein